MASLSALDRLKHTLKRVDILEERVDDLILKIQLRTSEIHDVSAAEREKGFEETIKLDAELKQIVGNLKQEKIRSADIKAGKKSKSKEEVATTKSDLAKRVDRVLKHCQNARMEDLMNLFGIYLDAAKQAEIRKRCKKSLLPLQAKPASPKEERKVAELRPSPKTAKQEKPERVVSAAVDARAEARGEGQAEEDMFESHRRKEAELRQKFSQQCAHLESMGFPDEKLNLHLLKNTKGDANRVADWLLEHAEKILS